MSTGLFLCRRLEVILLAIVMAWSAVPMVALADERLPNASRYSIKEESAQTGSNIKRAVVTSAVPLDKPYAKLSREEQEVFRSQYEDMAEDDEPPFPLEGLAAFYKPLQKALGHGWPTTGRLTLHVSVDSQGDATSVQVLASPSAEVTKIAATLAMLIKYKPGICGGKPCDVAMMPLEVDLRR